MRRMRKKVINRQPSSLISRISSTRPETMHLNFQQTLEKTKASTKQITSTKIRKEKKKFKNNPSQKTTQSTQEIHSKRLRMKWLKRKLYPSKLILSTARIFRIWLIDKLLKFCSQVNSLYRKNNSANKTQNWKKFNNSNYQYFSNFIRKGLR